MNGASNKAYISGRKLEQYRQERERLQQQSQQKSSDLPVIQESMMEESQPNIGAILNVGTAKFKEDEDVDMQEEHKKLEPPKEAKKMMARMQEEENASDDSAEGVDSDDLEDEIKDNVQDLMLQQQQQVQFDMPQAMPSSSLFGAFAGMQAQPQQQLSFAAQPQQQVQMQAQSKKKSSGGIGGLFGKIFGSKASQPKQSEPESLQQEKQQKSSGGFSFGCVSKEAERLFSRKDKAKYKQEVDTNVFLIKMEGLKDMKELATGDPVFCSKCQAIFNKHSVITEEVKEEQVWHCEFCLAKNPIQMEPEEIPKTEEVTYILEAAAQINDKKQLGKPQDISVVFCVDISGSMCVSTPIAGNHRIKGDRISGMRNDLMKFSDGSDQRIKGDHGMTYVSRLQCVQSAIDSQLNEMQKNNPDRKIGLVTFNNEVTVIGDGTKEPVTVTGDKLFNYDFLLNNGVEQASKLFQKSIKDTKDHLQRKLLSLEETGSTALGPAVLTAVSLAGEGAPGSTVIVCTDGLANIGLGALDEAKSEEQLKKIEEFYELIGQYAKTKGVTVNLISIKGDQCNIDALTKLSELTGGDVQQVEPKDLINNFNNLLQLQTIATNVQMKVKLHKGLEFRNQDPLLLSEDKTILARELGNVNEETEVTFEYRMKKVKELLKMADLDMTTVKSLPFQAQITYTALDGSRCVRVITNTLEISNDKEELQQQADFDVLGVCAVQTSAQLARGGNIERAQIHAKAWQKNMARGVTNANQMQSVSNYAQSVGGMYSMMNQERMQARGITEQVQMAQPMMQGSAMMRPPQSMQAPTAHFQRRTDESSSTMFTNSKTNSKAFQKKK